MRKRGPQSRPWYRKDRGWYVTKAGNRAEPLRHPETGLHIKDPKATTEQIEYAFASYVVSRNTEHEIGPREIPTVLQVCNAYLDECIRRNATSTYRIRKKILQNFCLHYGNLLATKVTLDTTVDWVNRNPGWKRPRTQLVAAFTAFNHAKKTGLLTTNPLRGIKLPASGISTCYLTKKQESEICKYSNKDFALAVRVCIATGARPGAEFAAVCPRHVNIDDASGRMVWLFPPEEAKDRRRERIVRIPAEIAEIVVTKMKHRKHNEPIFRNTLGNPWSAGSLRMAFNVIKNRLGELGIMLPKNASMYSCRHTFAKRQLELGKSIPQIAKLLGNSPSICQKHYAQWDVAQEDSLWKGLD